MRVMRGEYGAAPECWGGGNWRSPRIIRRPAASSGTSAKIRARPRRESDMVPLGPSSIPAPATRVWEIRPFTARSSGIEAAILRLGWFTRRLQRLASMAERRNEGAGETGDRRENPPTSGIVRRDSHMRKSGVTRPRIEHGSSCGRALDYSSMNSETASHSQPRDPAYRVCFPADYAHAVETHQRASATSEAPGREPATLRLQVGHPTPELRGQDPLIYPVIHDFNAPPICDSAGCRYDEVIADIVAIYGDDRNRMSSCHRGVTDNEIIPRPTASLRLSGYEASLHHFKELVGAASPRSRSEGAIRERLTRTPGASSLLRARRAVFPSLGNPKLIEDLLESIMPQLYQFVSPDKYKTGRSYCLLPREQLEVPALISVPPVIYCRAPHAGYPHLRTYTVVNVSLTRDPNVSLAEPRAFRGLGWQQARLHSPLYTRNIIVCLLVAVINTVKHTLTLLLPAYYWLAVEHGACLKSCRPITAVEEMNKCLKSTSSPNEFAKYSWLYLLALSLSNSTLPLRHFRFHHEALACRRIAILKDFEKAPHKVNQNTLFFIALVANFLIERDRSGAACRAFASHLGEPVSMPACGNWAGRCRCSVGFSRGYPIFPAITLRLCSILSSLHPHQLSIQPDVGEVRRVRSSTGMQRRRKRELPTCENPGVTPLGIEPGSPGWEVSGLTTTTPRPPLVGFEVYPGHPEIASLALRRCAILASLYPQQAACSNAMPYNRSYTSKCIVFTFIGAFSPKSIHDEPELPWNEHRACSCSTFGNCPSLGTSDVEVYLRVRWDHVSLDAATIRNSQCPQALNRAATLLKI
ncbi:hypothetical protein PR048_033550 [Dryococelus australis]|uniref:Uncharacterized protein n=1 Tax=Dryococelus australis TaxID=614101 RepID=A0ABQ9G4R9_9NEOP|nr:hypothetical protein PR048_033550 [Dryococelus australis]